MVELLIGLGFLVAHELQCIQGEAWDSIWPGLHSRGHRQWDGRRVWHLLHSAHGDKPPQHILPAGFGLASRHTITGILQACRELGLKAASDIQPMVAVLSLKLQNVCLERPKCNKEWAQA